jgi:putative flippase GtrA
VSLIASLKNQFAHLVHELAKFGSVGAIAFVITVAVSNALHHIGGMKSFAVATVVATTFAYFANRFWTFRHRETTDMRREYTLFFVLNAIGLGISELFIGFAQYTLGLTDKISYNLALIVGTGAATLFRYWSYKKWVFLAPTPAEPPVEPVTGLPEPMPAAHPVIRHTTTPSPAEARSH